MTSFEGRDRKSCGGAGQVQTLFHKPLWGYMKTEGREAEKEQLPCCFPLKVRMPRKDNSTPKKNAET